MTFIPHNVGETSYLPTVPITSWKLQNSIRPELIIERFSFFRRNKREQNTTRCQYHKVGFCDESGVEYKIEFIRLAEPGLMADLLEDKDWQAVVTIYDSLDPLKDVEKFVLWLDANFKFGTST
jgi:hypothetical protein